mmetsp:Transcript_48539/g.134630  ORF Transcript_48539/g.134630 Transcript_48539/m.134630 type:complete len:154 (+) Transcript_48539:100-561(+)
MGKKNKHGSGGGHQCKKPRAGGSGAEVGSGGPQNAEALKRQLRIKHMSQQLKKAEEDDDDGDGVLSSPTQKLRVQLADALIESGNHLRATAVCITACTAAVRREMEERMCISLATGSLHCFSGSESRTTRRRCLPVALLTRVRPSVRAILCAP